MPRNHRIVFVIPCSADKLDHAAPARELYRSTYFRGALAAALAETDEVLILSAKHGLIDLDSIVEPYDIKMGDPGSVEATTLAVQAISRGLDDDGVDVYGLLPTKYFDTLDAGLRMIDVYPAPVYEATSGIGDQKHVCSNIITIAAQFPDA